MIINKIKNNKTIKTFKWNISAFTISEVIIATFISTIVLSFIFIFLSDIVNSISNTKKEINSLSSFYEFTNKINNLNNIYISWSIIVETSTWSDIFLMKDSTWDSWILVWPVKLSDYKLNNDNTIYDNKWLWFRKVTKNEIFLIESNNIFVYDLIFQRDQVFSDLKIQDFVILSYNLWLVYNFSIVLDLDFKSSLIWQLRADLPKDSLIKLNIDL